MIKTAPRLWQLGLIVAFVLSCFGVLLYLWLAFGGSSPLQPQGYHFHVTSRRRRSWPNRPTDAAHEDAVRQTFVDLTPGTERTGTVPEGGTLPRASVAPTVELDEIFRSFDEETRLAFQTWMQSR